MRLFNAISKTKTKDFLFYLLFVFTMTITIFAAAINYIQDKSVDRTKIPKKVEESKGFQKWITNLKNKDIQIEADEFRLVEENEIYNTKWMQVFNIDEEEVKKAFEENINKHKNLSKVVFSPSGRQFIDYRNEYRNGYAPNQIHYYGLRDDKLLDARLLDCSPNLNCYFDRAYFLDNDVFVVSEISRNHNKRDPNIPPCSLEETCTYTFKVHIVDLNKNSRLVYESKPFETVLANLIPKL